MTDIGGSGIVLASYGRGVLVQTDGGPLRCTLKGRGQRIVCGDQVVWATPPGGDPSIQSIAPRRNLIERLSGCAETRARSCRQIQCGGLHPEPAPAVAAVHRS